MCNVCTPDSDFSLFFSLLPPGLLVWLSLTAGGPTATVPGCHRAARVWFAWYGRWLTLVSSIQTISSTPISPPSPGNSFSNHGAPSVLRDWRQSAIVTWTRWLPGPETSHPTPHRPLTKPKRTAFIACSHAHVACGDETSGLTWPSCLNWSLIYNQNI